MQNAIPLGFDSGVGEAGGQESIPCVLHCQSYRETLKSVKNAKACMYVLRNSSSVYFQQICWVVIFSAPDKDLPFAFPLPDTVICSSCMVFNLTAEQSACPLNFA